MRELIKGVHSARRRLALAQPKLFLLLRECGERPDGHSAEALKQEASSAHFDGLRPKSKTLAAAMDLPIFGGRSSVARWHCR